MTRDIARLLMANLLRAAETGTGGGAAAAAAATSTDTKAPEAAAALPGSVLSDAAAAAAAATDTKADTTAAAAETKADAGNKAAEPGKDGKAAAADAPITYTDFKLPDGVEVDAPVLDAAKTLFAESKLPQDQAQKFVDFYTEQATKLAQKGIDAWIELNGKWTEQFKADKEIGGDNLEQTVSLATKAMATFGTQGLRDALVITGAGNHPEIIRFFARVGKATGTDKTVPASTATAERRPTEAVLFDKMAAKE